MPKCIITIGLPGVGKSAWINSDSNWLMASNPNNWKIVSSDHFIEIEAKQKGKTYDEVFPSYVKTASKLFEYKLEDYILQGENIIIDRTNLSVNGRQKLFNKFHRLSEAYNFTAIVFEPPSIAVWSQRLKQRPGKTIPDNIIGSMVKSYQIPTEQEGFDRIVWQVTN